MSICIKVGFASKGSSHVCFRSTCDYVRIWDIYYRVVDVHSLDTKKIIVLL